MYTLSSQTHPELADSASAAVARRSPFRERLTVKPFCTLLGPLSEYLRKGSFNRRHLVLEELQPFFRRAFLSSHPYYRVQPGVRLVTGEVIVFTVVTYEFRFLCRVVRIYDISVVVLWLVLTHLCNSRSASTATIPECYSVGTVALGFPPP